jgi:hypothetical protein
MPLLEARGEAVGLRGQSIGKVAKPRRRKAASPKRREKPKVVSRRGADASKPETELARRP